MKFIGVVILLSSFLSCTSTGVVGRQEVLSWYRVIGSIRTKTNDTIPVSVVVDVVFGYAPDDTEAPGELATQQAEIKDFLSLYFSEKVKEELTPENEEKLRIEIRNRINDDILTASQIRDVKFLTLDVMD